MRQCVAVLKRGVLPLDDMIAALVELDANGLCLQWRNHLDGTPPAHLPRWLLMKILAYRIQAIAFGGLDKETLRVLRQPKDRRLASSDLHPFEARVATTREGTKLKAGALLAREWNGRLERVMILDQGVAWNGETYGSLSQVAKAKYVINSGCALSRGRSALRDLVASRGPLPVILRARHHRPFGSRTPVCRGDHEGRPVAPKWGARGPDIARLTQNGRRLLISERRPCDTALSFA
jgi:hypothetical protein